MVFTVVVITAILIVIIQAYLGYFIYRNSDLSLDNGHLFLFATAIRALTFGSIGILTLMTSWMHGPSGNVDRRMPHSKTSDDTSRIHETNHIHGGRRDAGKTHGGGRA
ncbi:hypothetical protein DFP72DRAFT_286836 [Ephemerocybe angulata]|uniref:Uncharacterized protein n=1 Tax=Ephemerocybe angulata TaxID=980116 RepID=A0A8H6M6D1_9AGAR|nr:hypothetical protein DFP72DRAFT_286836 [Tulosesus angulatus]